MLLWGKKSLKCTTFHLKPVLQSSSILSIMLPILKCTLIQPVHCELHVFLSIKTVEYIQSTLGQLRCVFLLRRLRTGLTFFHFNQVLLKQTLAFLFILLFMFRCGEWECVFSTVCLVHVCISQSACSACVCLHMYIYVSGMYLLLCPCVVSVLLLEWVYIFICLYVCYVCLCFLCVNLWKGRETGGGGRSEWMVVLFIWFGGLHL